MVSRDTLAGAALAHDRSGHSLEAVSPRYGEKIIKGVLGICAALSVATTIAIVVSLVGPALQFFGTVAPFDFLFGTSWSPSFQPQSFGVLPLVAGTVSVVLWGLLAAIPLGLGAAIYLSEYAPGGVRKVVKPILEVLEGVPTVAFGFFAFSFLTPLLQDHWPGIFGQEPNIFNAGAAGLAIGLLIVPIVASISQDAMSAVPQGLRTGAYALGASRMRVSLRVVFPAALSGIVAAIVLGVSRAIGETMVVLMAAGNSPNLNITFTESIQAMTAYIGVTATGDIATGTIEYDTIFAVGLLLFAMTLSMNALSIRLVRRYRQVYE
ncbi:phosphate ABC transporter permease subunit PstC [Mycolicibacterium iranicum]|uniref:Phosphate transport system permease protein n=1 Tax=Mycolicibacterium iranicum TaxID=912594 RepID=A0A178LNX6_MYCIR|nr:phosphate ABC transporter permease subunit PstC [Mycolicibacterium iranicum]OAN33574.1 phosphate ABC transporter permease subunit PstC [Mycolicibacterium iranicum]